MKQNQWTRRLAALGAISLASVAQAEEAQHAVMTALQSTTISGYVDTSLIWLSGPNSDAWTRNFNNTISPQTIMYSPDGNPANASPWAPPGVYGRAFDGTSKQNSFNLNVVDLAIEKPLSEGQWSAGYRVETWLGPDANTLGTQSTLSTGSGDFAIKNAYVALRAPVGNGLDFKFGVWDTIIGYEVADSPYNPNYSRSFAWSIEPVIHTGILATYQVSDVVTVQGGIAETGLSNQINANSGVGGVFTYLGSLAITAPESTGFLEGATAYFGIADIGVGTNAGVYDPAPGAARTTGDIASFYAGAKLPLPLEGWAIGAAYDYRANGVYNGSYENAVSGYLSWQMTEKLRMNGRVEYASGSRGLTIAGNNNNILVSDANFGAWGTPAGAVNGTTPDNVRLLGVTATLDYELWANAITRAEFRWDRTLNGQYLFQGMSRRNAVSLALNVIYQF